MYQFSDSESKDSEDGIRFKTDSTRNKTSNLSSSSSQRSPQRSRYRENSPKRRKRHSRSRSSDRRRRHRSRERSHREQSKRSESLSLSDEEVDRKRHPLKRKNSKHRRHRRSRSRSKKRESSHKNGRHIESGDSLRDDNKNKNFQEASDDRSDPPNNKREISCLGITLQKDLQPIGPALPPNFNQRKNELSTENVGPVLPPHLIKKNDEETVNTDDKTDALCVRLSQSSSQLTENNISPTEVEAENHCIGPVLPPHLIKKTELPSIGPMLPLHLQKKQEPDVVEKVCIGPTLPSHLREKLAEEAKEEEDHNDVYGPLPPGMLMNSAAHVALEERALQIKLDAFNPTDEKVQIREEWMLELPDVKAAHLGLGSRQFRNRAGPDLSDRSSWTDTPKDKEEKEKGKTNKKEVDLKVESERIRIQERDKQQEEVIKKHKKKKGDKSLLEMHQEQLKSKKGSEEKIGERRPFSRDIDLKVNRFDEAQKKSILKKAQLLDDRFSAGQSKFL